jgi:hypothetical protein
VRPGDIAMNRKTLYTLTGLTVILIGATIYLTPAPISERVAPGERLFANLDPGAVNSAATLAVTAKGKTVTIYKKDGAWVVKEMADYPADTALVRKALFALTELRPYEAKTKDPARLAKLELEDPKGKDAQSKQLTVKDKDGKVLADVIYGKANTTNVILGKEMVYVRKADSEQAWLAEGDPTLKAEPLDWILRAVIDVDVERVKDVETKSPKGELVLHIAKEKAEDKEYAIKNLPAGRKPKEARTVGYVAESLDNTNLDDVKKVGEIDFEKNGIAVGTWRTFDGLVIKAKMAEVEKKFWISLSAEVDEAALLKEKPKPETKLKDADTVRKEAAEINSRVRAWAYHLPTTSSRFMTYKLDDLMEPEKKDEKKEDGEKKSEEPKPAPSTVVKPDEKKETTPAPPPRRTGPR